MKRADRTPSPFHSLESPKLPLPNAPIGSEQTDFGATALFGLPLPADLSLDVNVSVVALGQAGDAGFRPQLTSQVALNYQASARFSLFAEGVMGTADEAGRDITAGFDVGAIYVIHPRVAVDLNLQSSYSGFSPDFAARAGVRFLVGR